MDTTFFTSTVASISFWISSGVFSFGFSAAAFFSSPGFPAEASFLFPADLAAGGFAALDASAGFFYSLFPGAAAGFFYSVLDGPALFFSSFLGVLEASAFF